MAHLDTARPTPQVHTLIDLLRWRAEHQPDQLAYTFLASDGRARQTLSYSALDQQARTIAAQLGEMTTAGARVLLLYPASLDYIAAFFGCLYADCVAVPAYPPQVNRSFARLQAIARDAQASTVLTTTQIQAERSSLLVAPSELRWLATDRLDRAAATSWQARIGNANTLAFLQYTSGSTAAPKGVMLSHGNLLANLALIERSFGHSSASQGVIWLPPYHDMGLIGGILAPLYSGFPVTLMAPISFLQRPLRWLEAISQEQGTTSGGPNFAYDLCVTKITPQQRATLDLRHWEVAFVGAEPVRAATLDRFAATFAACGFRREAFYPCYGLAEVTLIVTGGPKLSGPVVHEVDKAALTQHQARPARPANSAQSLVSSGQQLPDHQVVIADPATGMRCSPDQIGEIWVAGPSVAQGYWNNPTETKQIFQARLTDGTGPFLRTGDLGFVAAEQLFVAGRVKDLVIIRGANYYPQDIEQTAAHSHALLRTGGSAAFTVDGVNGEDLVVVHEVERRYRAAQADALIDAIRRAVAQEHALHVATVVLLPPGGVPKTSSGKIQRQLCRTQFLAGELSVIGSSTLTEREQRAAADALPPEMILALPPDERGAPLERYLQNEISHVLKLSTVQITRDMPINALGLDSLMAVELQHRLELDLGLVVPLATFWQETSVAQLAVELLEQLDANASVALPAVAVPGERTSSTLSYGQRALWFIHQLNDTSTAYSITNALRLRSALDVVAFEQALAQLVERHPLLHAVFPVVDGEPTLQIQPSGVVSLEREDAWAWSEAELERRVTQHAQRPFDLARGPLMRVTLYERGQHDDLLLLVFAHIIVDFWSLEVLLHELAALYTAEKRQTRAPLEVLTAQFADYIDWQVRLLNSLAGERLWRYWQQQLADAPHALNLPSDRLRPAIQTYRGLAHTFTLDAPLTSRLRTLAHEERTTLYTVLLAAFQVLLARHSGQSDILVGSPFAARSRASFAPIVGYFVNPLPLRANLGGNPTFRALLLQLRTTVLAVLEHQDYPFPLLVERLQPPRDPSRSPLFQVLFVLEQAHQLDQQIPLFVNDHAAAELDLGELIVEPYPLPVQSVQFDLALVMEDVSERVTGSFQFNVDLFDADRIARMVEHFQQLLAAIATTPEQPIGLLPLLSAQERQDFAAWNNTSAPYPADRCVHELAVQQVARTPDAIALVDGQQRLSYRELDRRANQLAHHLISLGVGPDSPVGLYLHRSIELIVGLFAILKAGGCYVPLDPAYPAERLQFMVQDARVRVLLTETALVEQVPEQAATLVCLDRDWPADATEHAPTVAVRPDHLAYIMYTSGSTGQPKGVALPHRALVNLIAWQLKHSLLGAGARTLQFSAISFDASCQEIFATWAAGGTLVLIDEQRRRDSEALLSFINEQAIERLFLPFVALQFLAEAAENQRCVPHSLREIDTAGEQLQITPQIAALLRALPNCALYNLYGPTESHVVTWHKLTSTTDEWSTLPPIGRPIDNTQIYLLDAQLQPVPIGVPGELYIGGVNLARGYLDRPALTAERFIPDPFAADANGADVGARLYRTGDLAQYQSDGAITFLGRIDEQVKIRGYRIEPSEIEHVLRQHPAVQDAVVIATDAAGPLRRLVAYVVGEQRTANSATNEQASTASALPASPAPRPEPLAPDALRAFLAQRLPEYMVPALMIPLSTLPLTPSGKINRRALPAPDPTLHTHADVPTTPRNAVEQQLAAIWAEVLGLSEVGIHDDFFQIGGHSLLATRVIARMRRAFQIDLALHQLFVTPTIAALAELVAQSSPTSVPIAPAPRDAPLPLSFVQQGLWFLDRLSPGMSTYNMPLALRLHGALDASALEQSLTDVIGRHEMLRTTFALHDDGPVQVVATTAVAPLTSVDLRALPTSERDTQLRQLIAAATTRPFDLLNGPLLRIMLIQLGQDEHVLIVSVHHTIFDEWSIDIFSREVAQGYRARLDRAAAEVTALPALPIQYADYSVWQRAWLTRPALNRSDGATFQEQLRYWRAQLGGAAQTPPAPILKLPTDWLRPPTQTYHGAAHSFMLPDDQSATLRTLSRAADTTLFMTLLASWQVLLFRYSGQTDIVVGTPVATRSRPEVEGVIGLFLNTLVLRTAIDSTRGFGDLLADVRSVALAAYANQDLPFEILVEALQLERDPSRHPLFQTMFVFYTTPLVLPTLPGLSMEQIPLEHRTAKFDLTLMMRDTGGAFEATLEYNTVLFDATTIERMAQHFQQLIRMITTDPQRPLAELPLITAAEQQRLLQSGELLSVTADAPDLLADLATRSAQHPDVVAVRSATELLSYGVLEARSNQVAHILQQRGVGPDVPVAICLEQSPELIVALLAVLKAGGAYLLLHPNDPPERLRSILEDLAPGVILTRAKSLDRLAVPAAAVLLLDSAYAQLAAPPSAPPTSRATDANLAYLIYSSGATERPYAVMKTRAEVFGRLRWMQRRYPLSAADVVLQHTHVGFDSMLWEVLWPLACGAAIIAAPSQPNAIGALLAQVAAYGVTTLHGMSSMLKLMLDIPDLSACGSLRHVLCSGAPLSDEQHTRFSTRLPGVTLHQLYGPATATSDVLEWSGTLGSTSDRLLAGRPIAGVHSYILDGQMQPVPAGVPGELYIAATWLARGYYRLPARTAEQFVPHPFVADARLFRTGERARYQLDGQIEVLGRQERYQAAQRTPLTPDEVERVLDRHPSVREAAVVMRAQEPQPQLVAYVTGRDAPPVISELRLFLKQFVPETMIPTVCITLDVLPLTPHGTIDRDALPLPSNEAQLHAALEQDYVAPRSEFEQRIEQIVARVLGITRVSVYDNFFEIGATSLVMAQIHQQIQDALDVEITLVDLFSYSTISELAEFLHEGANKSAVLDQSRERARSRKAARSQQRPRTKR